ncbi:hypothetical protein [Dubosiella newyorkensis]|uniref:hypothetical protein n=1 Tax=Dubosiella newyorkensis TaxID=1862672 RepID=UPI00272C3504|nr:hypothetical protein [Dubosiella newyorkensis]
MEKKYYNITLLSGLCEEEDGTITATLEKEQNTSDIYEAITIFQNWMSETYEGRTLILDEVFAQIDEEGNTLKESKPRNTIIEYNRSDIENQAFTFDIWSQILFQNSKYYNMKEICKLANVSYSSYRNFKSTGHYMSQEAQKRILKAMAYVGNQCWNDKLIHELEDIEHKLLHH